MLTAVLFIELTVAAKAFPTEKSSVTEFGLGAGSVLVTIFYTPVKLTYATLGLLTGSAAYVITGGSSTVANRIFTPSLRGTYLITPKHLKGAEPVEFFGKEPSSTIN